MTVGGTGGQFSLLGGRYHLLRELGKGGFGQTYLAEDSNRFHELCVLKEFAPQVNDPASLQKAKQLFEREAGVLYQLQHPQIPKFRELLRVYLDGRDRLFLVQDYVEGPTYHELLDTRLRSGRCFSEAEVTQLLLQLLPVLDYLHNVGVIHRDIAPDNLILRNADGLPVLIDFGGVKQLSTLAGQRITHNPTRLGKVGFAPEEQLQTGAVSPSGDLYALAATVLVLLTGDAPQDLYDRTNKQWHWPANLNLSHRFAEVLQKMLAPAPRDRYSSAAAVMQALQTPSTYAVPPSRSATMAVAPGRGAVNTLPVETAAAPLPPRPKAKSGGSGCFPALLGLGLVVGAVGLVWWVANRWEPAGTGTASSTPGQVQDQGSANPAFSQEEQSRKNAIRQQRQNLGVDQRFFVGLTDQLFYERYPEMQGKALTDRPEDATMRANWDAIALENLDLLERNLTDRARQGLGVYSASDRDRWRQAVNPLYVSSRAVFDLADARFDQLFPGRLGQEFIAQPIGQVWYGLAEHSVQGIQSGDRLEEIQFEQGSFGQSVRDRLEAGAGRVYILSLGEGQLLRLNLQAPQGSTQLSLYVPSPTDAVPYLLADSPERTWSGELPQSGYYEIVVVATGESAVDYALDIAVDNVTATPAEPPEAPEAKD
ncbi:MAG: protein kinase [Leptolyngbyaceae cyanobacterium]